MRKLFSRQLIEARHEMLSIYEPSIWPSTMP